MRPTNQQGGELIVIGEGGVHVPLQGKPHRIDVFFKKKNAPPPCDPHHHDHHMDQLQWKLHCSHGRKGYTLHIDWHVHEYREIVWLVYY